MQKLYVCNMEKITKYEKRFINKSYAELLNIINTHNNEIDYEIEAKTAAINVKECYDKYETLEKDELIKLLNDINIPDLDREIIKNLLNITDNDLNVSTTITSYTFNFKSILQNVYFILSILSGLSIFIHLYYANISTNNIVGMFNLFVNVCLIIFTLFNITFYVILKHINTKYG